MSASRRQSTVGQARLRLEQTPDFSRKAFVVSSGNAEALAAIESWPRWSSAALVVVGPAHAGKSHLAAIWARLSGAEVLGPETPFLPHRGRAVALEDADQRPTDEALFHLLNIAEPGATLLMTARATPRSWQTDLPDLRSRLNAMRVVEVAAPDDAVLAKLLEKFFRERNIRPEADVVPYLIRRIERSSAAAYDIVARIDEAADVQRRGITRTLARDVFDSVGAAGDLFD